MQTEVFSLVRVEGIAITMGMKVFKFSVDESWARKNNELLRDTRRLQTSAIIMAILLVAGAVAAFTLMDNHTVAFIVGVGAIILASIFALLAVVVPKQVGGAQRLYDSYPLAPAVVAEVNARDIVLLALVNTNAAPADSPRWGLALRTVSQIDGHERKVGVKVPVAAVSGRRRPGGPAQWDEITPMPIAWGTPDPDVITTARRSIPQEQWKLLERNRKKLNDVKRTKFNLLILDHDS